MVLGQKRLYEFSGRNRENLADEHWGKWPPNICKFKTVNVPFHQQYSPKAEHQIQISIDRRRPHRVVVRYVFRAINGSLGVTIKMSV
jgi:hypothetical protein